MRISDRVKNMKYSAVRKLAPLASEAEKKGNGNIYKYRRGDYE